MIQLEKCQDKHQTIILMTFTTQQTIILMIFTTQQTIILMTFTANKPLY